MIREVRREGEGAAQGECGYSSLRVREWMLTMNSHGVEISIAGCVEEMVRALNLMPFSFFCLLFVFSFMCFVLINYWEQRLRAALAMVKKEPHPLFFLHPGTREKAINPSLSSMRPTAHQPRKIRNPLPTRRSKRKIQVNPWGGINRKTLAVDANKIHNCYNH